MAAGVTGKALAAWVVILGLAMVNGVLREVVLIPVIGIPWGMVVSGLLLCGLILAVALLFVAWAAVSCSNQLILVGLGWLVLTLAFEFSFGLIQGSSLAEIGAAYTFEDGNIWPLVLVVTAVAPWSAARLRAEH